MSGGYIIRLKMLKNYEDNN